MGQASAGTASVSLRDGESEPDSFRGEMERWELESDEREDGEMKNKRMKKKKQSGIILIGMLNKKMFFICVLQFTSIDKCAL